LYRTQRVTCASHIVVSPYRVRSSAVRCVVMCSFLDNVDFSRLLSLLISRVADAAGDTGLAGFRCEKTEQSFPQVDRKTYRALVRVACSSGHTCYNTYLKYALRFTQITRYDLHTRIAFRLRPQTTNRVHYDTFYCDVR